MIDAYPFLFVGLFAGLALGWALRDAWKFYDKPRTAGEEDS